MPLTAEMLPFTSSYSCPVALRNGGGEGRWGLCVMELISILNGENDQGYAGYKSATVDESLRLLAMNVNDFFVGEDGVTPEVRADVLWPIIPSLLQTAVAGKHIEKVFHSNCGYETCCKEPSVNPEALAEKLGIPWKKRGAWALIKDYSSMDGDYEWDKIVNAFKVYITVFWSEAKKTWEASEDENDDMPIPQTDFTEEQYARLLSWLADLKAGNFFPNEFDGIDYNSSRTIREAA